MGLLRISSNSGSSRFSLSTLLQVRRNAKDDVKILRMLLSRMAPIKRIEACLFSLEELRIDDITNAVGDETQSAENGFFGISSSVYGGS